MAQPDWILDSIVRGLSRLATLSLDHTPAMDVIRATAVVWHEAVTHGREFLQERDRDRFDAAFRTLARDCRGWPSPRDFLDALPALQTPAAVARIDDEARRRRGMQHIGEIAKRMGWQQEDGDAPDSVA